MGIGLLFWILGCIIVSNVFIVRFMYVATRKGKPFEEKYSPDYIEVKDEFNKYDLSGYMKSYIVEVKDKTNLRELELLGWVTYIPKFGSFILFDCIEEMVKHVESNSNVIRVEEQSTGSLCIDTEIKLLDVNIKKYEELYQAKIDFIDSEWSRGYERNLETLKSEQVKIENQLSRNIGI